MSKIPKKSIVGAWVDLPIYLMESWQRLCDMAGLAAVAGTANWILCCSGWHLLAGACLGGMLWAGKEFYFALMDLLDGIRKVTAILRENAPVWDDGDPLAGGF